MGKLERDSNRFRLQRASVLSALIHALALWLIGVEVSSLLPIPKEEEQMVQVILIDSDEFEKQIIEFEKRSDQAPADSRFLAKHDYTAEKEMVAHSKSWDVTSMKPEEITRLLTKPNLEEITRQVPAIAKFFPTDPFVEVPMAKKQERAKRSLASEEMSDHIDKIQVGNETLLNTSEFKFYSYFSRIKSQVHRNWIDRVKGAALKSWMVGRPLASAMTHETQLIIMLDEEGRVQNILVKKSSGIQALDKASVEAFVESGPFPNPPKDLIRDQKNLQITWSFFVNVT